MRELVTCIDPQIEFETDKLFIGTKNYKLAL